VVPLRDKLHVLTLNAHSLLEWDTAFCLETMTDAILREEVDILVLQEVNQGLETVVAEQSELEASQFMPCEQEVPVRKDNYALAAAKLLAQVPTHEEWACREQAAIDRHIADGKRRVRELTEQLSGLPRSRRRV